MRRDTSLGNNEINVKMQQTHILELPKKLKVRFRFVPDGVDIVWSRKLHRKDIPNLQEFYVPWRNNILKNWAEYYGHKHLNFSDLPLIDLINRKPK